MTINKKMIMKTNKIFFQLIFLALTITLFFEISNIYVFAGSSNLEIYKAQKALKELGYDPGLADGIMGDKTRNALRAFQKSQNIIETGELDNNTKKFLDIKEDDLETKVYVGTLKAKPKIGSIGMVPFITTSSGVTIEIYGQNFEISEKQAQKLGLVQTVSSTEYIDGKPCFVTETKTPEIKARVVLVKEANRYKIIQIENIP